MLKRISLLLLALLAAILFGSCSFFSAVGHGIASLFFFVLKTALFLGGGIACAYFTYSYYEEEEKNKKRKNKYDASEKLVVGFLGYLAGVLGFCLYFSSPPLWTLIAGAVGCLLFLSCPRASKMPGVVWLITMPVFAVSVFLAASFTDIWETAFDLGAFISEILPVDFHFAIPVNFWTVLAAGGILALIPAKIVNAPLKAEQKRIEQIEREKKEAEERALRAEQERWKNLSLRDKIAELNSASLKKQKENDAALSDAKKQLAQAKSNIGAGDPEKILMEYIRAAGSSLSFQWRDFVSGSGVDEAKVYVSGVQDVARFFAARYCVAVCQARQEDERLTVNRKKTIVYAEQLTEIWDKLTAKQKERKISSAADSLKIGSVNVKIPDSLKSIDKLAVTYKDGNTEKLLGALGSYGDFRKQVNLGSETANVGVFLATLIGTGLLNNFSANQDLKNKLSNKIMRLYKKIEKIRKAEPQVKAFTARAYEINIALEKAMQAYAKMFNDVYRLLYPADDAEKSKEARGRRKDSGGDYFSTEESEAVLQLFTTGKFLLQIVDAKFEGDDDGE